MEINDLKKLDEPVFYITNDVGRGIGLESVLPNYHIVCLDDHPLVDILEAAGASVFCLERVLKQRNALLRNAALILDQPAVLSFIKEKSAGKRPNILFFKPQKKIEVLARRYGFNLLGNPVEINRLFEDKVAFFELCQRKGIRVLDGEINLLTDCQYEKLVDRFGEPIAIQFGRGWAGNTTFFVGSGQELEDLKSRFGSLKVKTSRFIEGITVLNNAVIFEDRTFLSRPALQVRADGQLTATQGGTGGRQWPAPLLPAQEEMITEITQEVGKLMIQKGYRGFFGLDFLVDQQDGSVYLSENNARLTASVPFYTKMELREKAFPLLGYHLLAFMETAGRPEEYLAPLVKGSEIVIRNTQDYPVMVGGDLKTGIYGENFEFKRESPFFDQGKPSDFWLEPAAQGRRVNPEIEVAKINTPFLVCDQFGRLNDQSREIVDRIKEELKLEKC